MSATHLLDTHTLLWALTDPTRLGAAARAVIEDRASRIVVSSASAWEIATKHRLGRLPHADVVLVAYVEHLRRLGAQSLPVEDGHALVAGSLNWEHRDPFDRMLAAQAMREGLTLITRDPAFATLPGVRILW